MVQTRAIPLKSLFPETEVRNDQLVYLAMALLCLLVLAFRVVLRMM